MRLAGVTRCSAVLSNSCSGGSACSLEAGRLRRPKPCVTAHASRRLAALIEHSLIVASEQPDGSTRFSMLETIREYGAATRGIRRGRGARDRHAGYFVGLTEQAAPHLDGPDSCHGSTGLLPTTTTCAPRWIGSWHARMRSVGSDSSARCASSGLSTVISPKD